jgi:hypothetical protein
MTLYHINVMWAIVLFGILLWTTACVVLNAALRRGMGIMGMSLSYGALVGLFDRGSKSPRLGVLASSVGITMSYEVDTSYAGTGRAATDRAGHGHRPLASDDPGRGRTHAERCRYHSGRRAERDARRGCAAHHR